MSARHEFETPGSVSLQVKLPSGRVVVTTVDEPRTTVDLVPLGRRGPDALEGIEVRLEERPGGHVLVVEERERIRWGPIRITWSGDVEVRIECPPGADLELSGASADLRVEGELGEVAARTASGDVRLDVVRRRLEVKTASGDVAIAAMREQGTVATVSGDLEIGSQDATLTARTVSGDVRVGTVAAPLTLSTTSGDIRLEAVEAGEVRIQSISGDARIGVAPGTPVWIDAASVSGELESQLGLSDGPPSEGGVVAVVPLHVKTVSGDVTIERAADRVPG